MMIKEGAQLVVSVIPAKSLTKEKLLYLKGGTLAYLRVNIGMKRLEELCL